MSAAPQEKQWLDWIASFRTTPHAATIPQEADQFLTDFERRLRERPRVSAGDRYTVSAPFQGSIVDLLTRRGIAVECPVASVPVPQSRDHCADLSFHHEGTRWIVEIKTDLSFNSLGAAVMGAWLFKERHPDARFVVVSLYAKSRGMQPGHLLEPFRSRDLVDDFIVVSVNSPRARWNERFAEGLKMLTAQLPGPVR